jgi:dihydrofolate reductase
MNAIFAVNTIDGFGVGNTMPWPHSSEDMKRFRELTTGHTVVMGASTWLSDMPKPLPNRRNCVLSTTLVDHRCEVYSNITSLMMDIQQDEQVFVIGGAKVLWALRPQINRVYFTRHVSKLKADITLNTDKYLEGFTLVSSEVLDKMTVEVYERP